MEFPQYRKYAHNKTFFKISSFNEFEEIQIQGNGIKKYTFKAKILPDRNYISDLVYNKDKNWIEIEEKEYNKISSMEKSSSNLD